MGTAAASAGAAGPSEGLRAGRSSWRTKPEYPAASGRHDHATFGSGTTRQSDDRTRSQTTCYVRRGTGRVEDLTIIFERFFLAQLTAVKERRKQPFESAVTSSFFESSVTL